jgi:signal transduction histidine kinase
MNWQSVLAYLSVAWNGRRPIRENQRVQQKPIDGPKPAARSLAARLLTPLTVRLSLRNAPPHADTPSKVAHVGMGLSAKLLLLTAVFVMLAEILIFLPSVANFRINWLTDRLTAARLASLAADAHPDHDVPVSVRQELLNTAKVRYVAIKQSDMRRLVLPPDGPIDIDRSYDLRQDPSLSWVMRLGHRGTLITDALSVLFGGGAGTIRVYGHPASPAGSTAWGMNDFVEIVLPEAPLRAAMVSFALNILALSIIISLIAAALVYVALNHLLVQPILRIAGNMEQFGRSPENASLIIEPSNRRDEVGTAERELQHMQQELRSMLNQKNHLAALGLAVSKISHDLRNILATAQLLSDRLATVEDPSVQRFAPKLIASVDRAIALCNDTLRYGKAEDPEPRRTQFGLGQLVEEVGEGLGLPRAQIAFANEVPPSLVVDADRDQLYRVFNNLIRNAVQAFEQQPGEAGNEIRITAARTGANVVCDVADDGPGIPEKTRKTLFRAFQSGARKGGSGLGLAIAAELVAAHGGRVELIDTERGAKFRITLPDRSSGNARQ